MRLAGLTEWGVGGWGGGGEACGTDNVCWTGEAYNAGGACWNCRGGWGLVTLVAYSAGGGL